LAHAVFVLNRGVRQEVFKKFTLHSETKLSSFKNVHGNQKPQYEMNSAASCSSEVKKLVGYTQIQKPAQHERQRRLKPHIFYEKVNKT